VTHESKTLHGPSGTLETADRLRGGPDLSGGACRDAAGAWLPEGPHRSNRRLC